MVFKHMPHRARKNNKEHYDNKVKVDIQIKRKKKS